MKIRNGFVSNSSSSSFCIYKKLMTEEQIKEFKEILNAVDYADYETCICEIGEYFLGDIGMHDRMLYDWLARTFKNNEYAISD